MTISNVKCALPVITCIPQGQMARCLILMDTHTHTHTYTHTHTKPSQMALVVKNPHVSAGDARDENSVPGSERSSGRGNGNPLLYCLGNPRDRRAWQAIVHRVAKSRTQLSTEHTRTHKASIHKPKGCKLRQLEKKNLGVPLVTLTTGAVIQGKALPEAQHIEGIYGQKP